MKIASASALSLTLLLGACQTSQAVKSAHKGENSAAREALEQEDLDRRRAVELAQAVLGHDIAAADGHPGRDLIRSLDACTVPLQRALRKRSRRDDAVAAEAAMLLVEHDAYRGKRLHRYRDDPDGAWRALGARATEGDQEARTQFFTDDDQRVRRAALRAALRAKDERDIPALLEASRVDPDPVIRNHAIVALGRIGGERVLLALMDRFPKAEEAERLAIVDAFASPALAASGGLARIRSIAESEAGFAALSAASRLARGQGEEQSVGISRLIRFARTGTTQERRLALRLLPGDNRETETELRRQSQAEDQATALIAHSRLLSWDAHRAKAQAALLEWARGDDELAYQAKAALAAAGAQGARELFLSDVSSPHPEIRIVSGYGLLRLEDYDTLAPLLADDDGDVRVAIGCRLLSSER